jgi:Uma2 family endonuclease
MAVNLRERLTVADLARLEALPENADKRFELIDGEVKEMATGSGKHGWIANLLAYYLTLFVLPRRLGYVFSDMATYVLSESDKLIPDGSFLPTARKANLNAHEFNFAPDIAIEVVSPSNSAADIRYKTETYLRFGVRLVWVIYPDERIIDVFTRAEDGALVTQTVYEDGTLTGGAVLPGFELEARLLYVTMPDEEPEA